MTTTKLALGAKLALGLAALAAPSLARAEDANVAVEIVEAMNKLFGAHAGFRAVHAKGIVVEGSFRGSSEGQALSSAVLFDGSTIPATVRFSDHQFGKLSDFNRVARDRLYRPSLTSPFTRSSLASGSLNRWPAPSVMDHDRCWSRSRPPTRP